MDTDEEVLRNLHLINHRLKVLEEERLPYRVASMEPTVKRMEQKIDELGERFEKGLCEVRDSINDQRSLVKGAIWAAAVIAAATQLIPIMKTLLA